MLTRRIFLAAAAALTESAYAQRAAVRQSTSADTVWLNANEFPEPIPAVCVEAMQKELAGSNRYHYQQFEEIYARIAASEDLAANQIMVGAGSSEPLHAAVDAFTSATAPLIVPVPTYESAGEVAAALGRKVVRTPLTADYRADVHRLAEAARQAHGGLIYLCNPNNPTSSIVPANELAWLISNLPENAILMVDEAYSHFATPPEFGSAIGSVRAGKNVIVLRTFSKIFGMAGLRVGFAAARPDLIDKMQPFRNNVISYLSARAVTTALDHASEIVPRRRELIAKTRNQLCASLKADGIPYIEPHANFMTIDVSPRDVHYYGAKFAKRGVAVGRPFPPLEKMLRVSIGSNDDIAKFTEVFRALRA